MKTIFSFPETDETVKKKMTFDDALNHVQTYAYFHVDDIKSLLDYLFRFGFRIMLGKNCYIAENEKFVIRVDKEGNGIITRKGEDNV